MKLLLIALLCLSLPSKAFAEDWSDFVDYVLSCSDTDDEETLEAQLDMYEQLHINKLNINEATFDDLCGILFVTPEQAEEIIFYREHVRGIKSMHELYLITKLDYNTRRWLPLFITIGEYADVKRKLRFADGRHTLLTYIDIPLYERAGYTADSRHRYQGSSIAHTLRYQYELNNKLSIAFAADKDQGEPVGKMFTMGYDFVGAHFMLKNLGHLKYAVLGDYTLRFGEGLLVNQGFTIGKTSQMHSNRQFISAKSSASEINFMRGAAVTIEVGSHITITPFVGYNMLDATKSSVKSSVSSLSQITTHRNSVEIAKHNITSRLITGLHAAWNQKRFNFGLTGFYSKYYLSFSRGNQSYRKYYPEGDTFYGLSADYSYQLRHITVQGELATNGKGTASLTRLYYIPSVSLQAQLAYRYYSPNYHSFHSNALSEWGVQNETGFFASVRWDVLRQLHLSCYADFFQSPYMRYGINHPSNGVELRFTSTYNLTSRHDIEFRSSWKQKERYNIRYVSQRYQLRWKAKLNTLDLSTDAYMTHYSNAKGKWSLGYAIQSKLRWRATSDKWQFTLCGAWFSSADYDSRLYLSEPSMTGSFPFVMLYGSGLRVATVLRTDITQNISVMMRYTLTHYTDRTEISSGLQKILSPNKNDISFQLKLKI